MSSGFYTIIFSVLAVIIIVVIVTCMSDGVSAMVE